MKEERIRSVGTRVAGALALLALSSGPAAAQTYEPWNCIQPVGEDWVRAGRVARSLAYWGTPDLMDLLKTPGNVGPWIQGQLDPDNVAEDLNGPMGYVIPILELPAQQGDPTSVQDQVQEALTLALYSNRQLRHKLWWFWKNHFSVNVGAQQQFLENNHAATYWLNYKETEVFRQGGMEYFEDLLLASATNPLMILYLDSDKNTKNKPNENYAREVLELHTVGGEEGDLYTGLDVATLAEVFTGWTLGKLDPADVGNPLAQEVDNTVLTDLAQRGDVDKDGYVGLLDEQLMIAQMASGVYNVRYDIWPFGAPNGPPLNPRDLWWLQQNIGTKGWEWSWRFEPTDHAYGPKTLFDNTPVADITVGGSYQPNNPLAVREGLNVIAHVAVQPQTAEFVSRKLFTYFVDDDPPSQATIDDMVASWVATGGRIGDVLDVLFHSAEFTAQNRDWGKVQSPFEYVVGMVRAFDGDAPLRATEAATIQPIKRTRLWLENDLKHFLFRHGAPDGFPEKGDEQVSSSVLLKLTRYIQLMWEPGPSPNATAWPDYEYDLVGLLQGHGVNTNNANAVVNYFARLLFQCNFTIVDGQVAMNYLTDDGAIDLSTLTTPQKELRFAILGGLLGAIPQALQQ